MSRYVIYEQEGFNQNRVFHVGMQSMERWKYVEVWHDGGRAYCASCSNTRSAMSGSCRHAKAVKRFVKE